MQKSFKWSTVLIVIVLTCLGSRGQKSSAVGQMPGVVRFKLVDQARDAPATIFSIKHESSDAFAGGTLVNASDSAIVAYRIGWAISAGHRTFLGSGPLMRPRVAVQPKQPFAAGSLSLGLKDLPGSGEKVVFFFVEFVRFKNGKMWKADTAALRRLAAANGAR